MLLYAQKDTLVFIAWSPHQNRVDQQKFDGLENGTWTWPQIREPQLLLEKLSNAISASVTLNTYWNIIKGSSQGWFLWLVCLTDLIDTPHGFYSSRVTGTFQTVLSIWDVLFSLILKTILRVKSSTSGKYILITFSTSSIFKKSRFWKMWILKKSNHPNTDQDTTQ